MNLLCAFNLCLFAFRSEPEYKNHEEESNVEWENSQLDICLIYEIYCYVLSENCVQIGVYLLKSEGRIQLLRFKRLNNHLPISLRKLIL